MEQVDRPVTRIQSRISKIWFMHGEGWASLAFVISRSVSSGRWARMIASGLRGAPVAS